MQSIKKSERNCGRRYRSSFPLWRRGRKRRNGLCVSKFLNFDKGRENDDVRLGRVRQYLVRTTALTYDDVDALLCSVLLARLQTFSSTIFNDHIYHLNSRRHTTDHPLRWSQPQSGVLPSPTNSSKHRLKSHRISFTIKSLKEGKIYFLCKSSTAAPIVPVRTHASTQHRHPTLHRPQPHPPEAPSSNSASLYSLNNLSKSKVSSDVGTRNQTSPPSAEYLHLDTKKSVPMNSLYKSLLDKPYFHPVTRNALSNILIEDGMFLVRPSTHSQHLLTLSISNNGKIFNIVVRTREDSKFALGTKKPGEMSFFTVDEMIKFHGREVIKVEDGSLVYLKRSPLKDKTF